MLIATNVVNGCCPFLSGEHADEHGARAGDREEPVKVRRQGLGGRDAEAGDYVVYARLLAIVRIYNSSRLCYCSPRTRSSC